MLIKDQSFNKKSITYIERDKDQPVLIVNFFSGKWHAIHFDSVEERDKEFFRVNKLLD